MSEGVPPNARAGFVLPGPLSGRVETHRLRSAVLEGNPWGDPTERELSVYVPPSGVTEGLPLLVALAGYTGSGPGHFQRSGYLQESLVALVDRAIREGGIGEVVLTGPDCLTTLGGSQYLNSTATGRYEDYVVEEVVPFVRERYRTGPVGLFGSSSGGYGAFVLGLRHPELFPAIGADVPDACFEYCFLPEFPAAARSLRDAGGTDALLRRLLGNYTAGFGPKHPDSSALLVLAMASCYSPDEREPGRFELPFDVETGRLREEVWARWLAWDPVRLVRTDAGRRGLRALRHVVATAGVPDEFRADASLRVLVAAARAEGGRIEHREFAGGHFDKAPRYRAVIESLARALGAPGRDGPLARSR